MFFTIEKRFFAIALSQQVQLKVLSFLAILIVFIAVRNMD